MNRRSFFSAAAGALVGAVSPAIARDRFIDPPTFVMPNDVDLSSLSAPGHFVQYGRPPAIDSVTITDGRSGIALRSGGRWFHQGGTIINNSDHTIWINPFDD